LDPKKIFLRSKRAIERAKINSRTFSKNSNKNIKII